MKGIFSTCQASLVKGIIQVHATLLSQWKYITYNPWITESAAETIHISSVEYCKVFQQGLYPSDVCETRIRWKRCSIWEHCVYLGPSSWNGKCQNGVEQRQHLNRKCVCRRWPQGRDLVREEHGGTPKETASIYQPCNVKCYLQSGVSSGWMWVYSVKIALFNPQRYSSMCFALLF